MTPFEAGAKILLFFRLISGFQALLGVFGLVGGGISIHDTHVVNTFHPLRTKVSDEYIPLQISFVLWMLSFELVLPSTYSTTFVDFGVVTHIHWGEGLALKVGNPITYLVVTRCDEAPLLAVEGVAYAKFCTTSIEMLQ